MSKFAGIIINSTSNKLDKLFTYKIPDTLQERNLVGYRVLIPFGKSNKETEGFVIEAFDENNSNINIKKIINITEEYPLLYKQDIELIRKMCDKYLCTFMECIRVMLPGCIFKGMKCKTQMLIYAGKELEKRYSSEPYFTIYNKTKQCEGLYTRNKLSTEFGFSLSSINSMIKNGFLIQKSSVVNRYNQLSYPPYIKRNLNLEQLKAVEKINGEKKKFLIHGVTGSGKTEIYMHLVEDMIKNDKDSIILVPEIALTPQMVERFKGRFGSEITVYHSRLSDGERYDEWLRVKEGKVKVAIGARSAIFLPFKNVGLIVIDEEHEMSYKSESDPKYDTRQVAEMICSIKKCKLVMGSATPSLETYLRCSNKEIELININERADNALMPSIEIIDMRQELINNNKSIFSTRLYNGIKDKLDKKEQVILFLNRRGFSTFVSCRKCGFVFKCDRCDIALTYHRQSSEMVCHYCGRRKKVPHTCPTCGSKYVKFFGTGTEKVDQEVKKLFPKVRTIRMDFDTTRKKDAYETIYNDFKNGNSDILIGTSMVAKGLDFKNVTLVGVIAADLSLNFPDFKSGERTFQLITQVAGRAGRGKKKGEVIIQTYSPENYSIKFAASGDYLSFFNEELKLRSIMQYPPFSTILLINLSSKNENILIKKIQSIGVKLKFIFKTHNDVHILGPVPCEISKIKDMFRWQIVIKGEINNVVSKDVKKIVYDCLENGYNDIRVNMDINPNSFL